MTGPIRRTKAIFDAVVELPAADRLEAAAKACGDDAELFAMVKRLLASDDTTGRLLDSPIARLDETDTTDRDTTLAPGIVIDAWRLIEPIGRGGMGDVWKVERADGTFHRVSALKVIRRGMDTDDIIARFERERSVLAGLQHPNIAALLDAGQVGDGRPYFVMELVDGMPIDKWCAANDAGLADRVRLMEDVCDAVDAAHRALVVHRDLKPSNILIDADGSPKLVDFGIAKIVNPSGHDAHRTEVDRRMLTPRYASPEQWRNAPVTTGTDVYAMGVILHELLTGAHPAGDLTETPDDLAHRTMTVPPRRASQIATETETTWAGQLRGDLDAILSTALRIDPQDRYASARDLGRDLAAWRLHLPLTARADTTAYRLKTFVRRHRLPVASAVVIAFSLLAASVVSTLSARHSMRAARDSRTAESVAEDRAEALASELVLTTAARERAEREAAASLLDAAEVSLRSGDVRSAAVHLQDVPESRRGWGWNVLTRRLDSSVESWDIGVRAGRPHVSDSGDVIVLVRTDAFTVCRRGIPDVEEIPIEPQLSTLVASAVDASGIVAVAVSADNIVMIDLPTRGFTRVPWMYRDDPIRGVACIDANQFAVLTESGELVTFGRSDDGDEAWVTTAASTGVSRSSSLIRGPGGLLLWSDRDAYRRFDTDANTLLPPINRGETNGGMMAIDPGARTLATCSWQSGIIALWDLTASAPLTPRLLETGLSRVGGIAFGPGATSLYAVGANGDVRCYHVDGPFRRRSDRFLGGAGYTSSLAGTPDGREIIVSDGLGVVRRFSAAKPDVSPGWTLADGGGMVWGCRASDGALTLGTTRSRAAAFFVEPESGRRLSPTIVADRTVQTGRLAGGADDIVFGLADRSAGVARRDPSTGQYTLITVPPLRGANYSVVGDVDDDGTWVTAAGDWTLTSLPRDQNEVRFAPQSLPVMPWQVAAIAGRPGVVLAMDVAGNFVLADTGTGEAVSRLTLTGAKTMGLLTSGDGRFAVARGDDQVFVVGIDGDALTLVTELPIAAASSSTSVAWQPGSALVAIGGADGVVHVVDAAVPGIHVRLRPDRGAVLGLAWDPDGGRLWVQGLTSQSNFVLYDGRTPETQKN